MYGSDKVSDDSERTAFRRAEKKYKLYYDPASKKKKQPKKVDLSEVLDFKSILESYNENSELPNGFNVLRCDSGRPVFSMESRPVYRVITFSLVFVSNCGLFIAVRRRNFQIDGFYFLPGALNIREQCKWIKESLTSFPQPPNRTNHNAFYGPINDLFLAATERKILVEDGNSSANLNSGCNVSAGNGDVQRWKFFKEDVASSRGNTCKSISASVLLRKLRWSTLGLQFDWSKRNYDVSLPHNKIPTALGELAKRMAAPAMPLGEEFKPEAAIVNYFGLGDSLGGHLDDMEADWSKPIVSISLGCKAIFLLGGKSREDPPLAMFLRSGDVVLMAGEARECFHGVPRIFTDKENAEIAALELQFSHEDDHCFLEYIQTSRININIRQVY